MIQTKIGRRAALLALAAGALALLPSAAAAQAAKKRILMVTHTAGFRHNSIPDSEEVMTEIAGRTGQWEVEFARTADEVRQMITPENLRRFDLVFFGNTTGELPFSDEAKQAFVDWLKSGKGFAGAHAATDTFYKWSEFGKIIGGYFDGHPWHQKVVVRVEDAAHPATRHLGSSFEITDEIYQFKEWSRGDKRVLLSIDPSSIDVSRGKRADKDYAVAWVSRYGDGRVFYTSLGHRIEVWRDPRFQEHLIGGLRWALGLVPGSTEPNPQATAG